MTEKINLQDLIDLLLKQPNMEELDVAEFVRAFWETIEEGLLNDGIVKVKGLGTFKLVGVESRESINVNTGERFEIQQHSKITFMADSSMRNIINKPFSHFESVILNDGTTFDDVEESVVGESEPKEEPEKEQPVEQIPAEPLNENVGKESDEEKGQLATEGDETCLPVSETVNDATEEVSSETPNETCSVDNQSATNDEADMINSVAGALDAATAVYAEMNREIATDDAKEYVEQEVEQAEDGMDETSAADEEKQEEVVSDDSTQAEAELVDTERSEPDAEDCGGESEEVTLDMPNVEEDCTESELEANNSCKLEEVTVAEEDVCEPVKGLEAENTVETEIAEESQPKDTDNTDTDNVAQQNAEQEEEAVAAPVKVCAEEQHEMQPEAVRHSEPISGETDVQTKDVHQRLFSPLMIILLIIITIGGTVVWYNMTKKRSQEKGIILKEEVAPTSVDRDKLNAADTLVMKATDKKKEIEPTKEAVQPENEIKEKVAVKTEVLDSAVKRKETIADTLEYEMVGVLAYDTIRPGNTLAKFANKYYGNRRLWQYIAAYNKSVVENPNNVPIGTALKIPKLQKK